jgi:hypothetical protein
MSGTAKDCDSSWSSYRAKSARLGVTTDRGLRAIPSDKAIASQLPEPPPAFGQRSRCNKPFSVSKIVSITSQNPTNEMVCRCNPSLRRRMEAAVSQEDHRHADLSDRPRSMFWSALSRSSVEPARTRRAADCGAVREAVGEVEHTYEDLALSLVGWRKRLSNEATE